MTQPELLTTTEVAELVGISHSYVTRWCDLRRISHLQHDGDRRYLYPADAVHAAHKRETTIPPDLRLRRWVAKALIT